MPIGSAPGIKAALLFLLASSPPCEPPGLPTVGHTLGPGSGGGSDYGDRQAMIAQKTPKMANTAAKQLLREMPAPGGSLTAWLKSIAASFSSGLNRDNVNFLLRQREPVLVLVAAIIAKMQDGASKIIGAGESGARVLESAHAQSTLRQLHYRCRLPFLGAEGEATDEQLHSFIVVLGEVLLTIRALVDRMTPISKLQSECRALANIAKKGEDTDSSFLLLVDELYHAYRTLWGPELFKSVEKHDLRDFLPNITLQLGDSLQGKMVDLADRYVTQLHSRGEIDLSEHAYGGGVAVRGIQPGPVEFVRIIGQPLEMVLIARHGHLDDFWQLVSATIFPIAARSNAALPAVADVMQVGSDLLPRPEELMQPHLEEAASNFSRDQAVLAPVSAPLNDELTNMLASHTTIMASSLKQLIDKQETLSAQLTDKLAKLIEANHKHQRAIQEDTAAELRILSRKLDTLAGDQTELAHAKPSRLNLQDAIPIQNKLSPRNVRSDRSGYLGDKRTMRPA